MQILWVALLVVVSSVAWAVPQRFDVSQDLKGQYLGLSMEYCLDPSESSPTFEEILPGWDRMNCKVSEKEVLNLLQGRGSLWLKVYLNNPRPEAVSAVVEHSWPSDYLRMILVSGAKVQTDEEFGGDVYRIPHILHRYSAQKMVFPPGDSEIYLRWKHVGTLMFPFRIWSEELFQHSDFAANIAVGILVGVTVSMVLYNIFLFVTFRVTQQLYYVGMLISTLWYLLFCSGLFSYIPAPWRDLWSKNWITAACLMVVFLCYFTLHFNNLRQKSRFLFYTFHCFAVFYMIAIISQLWRMEVGLIIFNILLSPFILICIWTGILGISKRERPAFFYLLSFTLVLLGGSLENLIALGVVDQRWTFWPFFAASNLQSILLSLAMGDKMHLDQKQAHNRIISLNKELQDHVEHVQELVDAKTREIRSMMANIPQGILMIQDDLMIHPDYSAYCTQLFEQKKLEGLDALTVILKGAQIGPDRVAQVRSALQASIGEDALTFQLNEDCFFREFKRSDHNNEPQVIEIDWHPILTPDGNIERFLVSARDVTRIRLLQHQSDEQSYRLELIGEIIHIDPRVFGRFIKSCRAFSMENMRLLRELQSNDPEVNKIIFINVHTMKGVARTLHLIKMADLFHMVENHLSKLRMAQVEFSQKHLLEQMEKIDELLSLYESVLTRDLGRVTDLDENAVIPIKALEPFIIRVDQLDINNHSETISFVSEVRKLFTNLYYQDPHKIFTEAFSGLGRLAKDLGKEVPQVQMELGEVLIVREGEDLIRNIFVHLLRNTMDHGIENAEERQKNGKSAKGLIEVKLHPTADGLQIHYRDDGRGLDLNAIRKIALRKKLLQEQDRPTLMELVQFIFKSGFSTSNTVSEISGRGVGMDAVSRYIQEHGGSIRVELPPNADLSWEFLPISFHITFPTRMYHKRAAA